LLRKEFFKEAFSAVGLVVEDAQEESVVETVPGALPALRGEGGAPFGGRGFGPLVHGLEGVPGAGLDAPGAAAQVPDVGEVCAAVCGRTHGDLAAFLRQHLGASPSGGDVGTQSFFRLGVGNFFRAKPRKFH